MDSIGLLLEEYKIVVNIGEKYFDRMYATLNFIMLFYGAVLTLMYNATNSARPELVFGYLLPVGTYILGLFYAYNSFAVTKQGLHCIRIENLIKQYSEEENHRRSFIGWNILAKSRKYSGNYILPYGTSLIFFIFAPVFDLIMVLEESSLQAIVDFAKSNFENYIICIFPIVFYCIYLLFMIVIIVNIIKLHYEIKAIQIYVN